MPRAGFDSLSHFCHSVYRWQVWRSLQYRSVLPMMVPVQRSLSCVVVMGLVSLPAPAGHVVDSGAGDLQIERPLNLSRREPGLPQGDDHGPLQVAGLGIVVCLPVQPAVQAKRPNPSTHTLGAALGQLGGDGTRRYLTGQLPDDGVFFFCPAAHCWPPSCVNAFSDCTRSISCCSLTCASARCCSSACSAAASWAARGSARSASSYSTVVVVSPTRTSQSQCSIGKVKYLTCPS